MAGGHAVKMVGWGVGTEGKEAGVPYWKVANSWNPCDASVIERRPALLLIGHISSIFARFFAIAGGRFRNGRKWPRKEWSTFHLFLLDRYWGEKGYFRIKRGNDECGIARSAVASSEDAKWAAPSVTNAF